MVYTLYGKELVRDFLATEVTAMAFGSSGSPDYTEQSDITLGSEFLRLPKDSTDASIRSTVTFETILTTLDGIGSTFKEVGLFDTTTGSAGSLIARTVYPPTEKDEHYEINFIYTTKVI